MKISALQRYILIKAWENKKNAFPGKNFLIFIKIKKLPAKEFR